MSEILIKSTLSNWGYEDIEIVGETIWFTDDGMECSILKEEFSDNKKCLSNVVLYSCCGEVLDKDFMICPKCGEHC